MSIESKIKQIPREKLVRSIKRRESLFARCRLIESRIAAFMQVGALVIAGLFMVQWFGEAPWLSWKLLAYLGLVEAGLYAAISFVGLVKWNHEIYRRTMMQRYETMEVQ